MSKSSIAYVLIMLLVVSVAVSVSWYSANGKIICCYSPVPIDNEGTPITNYDINVLPQAVCPSDSSWDACFAKAFRKPLAVVLDFGNKTQFIDESFTNRFYSDLVNISLLHPSVLIIKMNSDGGVGYSTDRGWMWFPIEVGRMIRLFNATTWFYVPHECISGCWVASSYASVIAGLGINDFNHTRAEVGNATYDWAYSIESHNNADGRGIRAATPRYHTDWPTFLDTFSEYEIKVIRA